jgi:hypothetical protein
MEIDMRTPNIYYVVGNGILPENTAAGQISRNIAVGLLIDIDTSTILDACVTLRDPLAIEFVRAQLVGRNFEIELEEIILCFDRYQSSAQKAIIVAVKAAYDRYKTCKLKAEKGQHQKGPEDGI